MLTYDAEGKPVMFDEAVIAARPVRWTDWPEPVHKMVTEMLAAEAEPPIYPGSINQKCDGCQIEISVGPRSQELVAACDANGRPVFVGCFLCAAKKAADERGGGNEMLIGHLGNDFKKAT